MTILIPQVVLAAHVGATGEAKEEGQICKFDLSTGLSLGSPYKEYWGIGACSLALLPPSEPDFGTVGFVALNGTNASLNLYLIDRERPIQRSFGHEGLSALALSPEAANGTILLAAGTSEGLLLLWDLVSGELLARLEGAHYQRIGVLRFSMDGEVLVTGGEDGMVRVWDVASLLINDGSGTLASPLLAISDHLDAVLDLWLGVGIGRNLRLLSAGKDCTVRLYDLVDGQSLGCFSFPAAITTVRMTSSETMIFAGAQDGRVYLVNLEDDPLSSSVDEEESVQQQGQFLERATMVLKGHGSPLTAMSLSLDEKLLVTGEDSGVILVWSLPSRQLARRIEPRKDAGHLTSLQIITKQALNSPPLKNHPLLHLTPSPLKRALSDASQHGHPPILIPPSRPTLRTDGEDRSLTAVQETALAGREETERLRESYLKLLEYVSLHVPM